ncbi:MAG: membrane dipeptidase [Erysipelotrichaceae bacterium]
MKYFDLHADIGHDVYEKDKLGIHHVIKDIHLPKFTKGHVTGINMVSFFEGSETWADVTKRIELLEADLATCSQFKIIDTSNDLNTLGDKIAVIFSIEGMCAIDENFKSQIDYLYDHHIRIASLTWNDTNRLATGCEGEVNRGLSELGIKVVHYLEEKNILIDVSHANETTFWDIMKHSKKTILATHSNASSLCLHPRNISDEQIKAIANRDGIIGLNGCEFFVSSNPACGDIEHFVEHAKYMKDLVGIEHIALGLDFMDIFSTCDPCMCVGLSDTTQLPNLDAICIQAGFSEDERNKLYSENVINLLLNNLK